MTAGECIVRIDGLKYNTYSREDKLRWLSQLEAKIQTEVVERHENPVFGFGEGLDRELIAGEAWEEMYLYWLEAKIDYRNGEYDRHNNAMDMFMAEYQDFRAWYTRTHMPISSGAAFLM